MKVLVPTPSVLIATHISSLTLITVGIVVLEGNVFDQIIVVIKRTAK